MTTETMLYTLPVLLPERELVGGPGLPKAALEHVGRGVELSQRGNHEEAVQEYNAALKVAPGLVEALYDLGTALGRLGRYEEALAAFDQAITIQPDFAEANCNRGVALGRLDRNEEAMAAYDRALVLRHDYWEAHYNRGVALGRLGRYGEALAGFDQAIALRPDFVEARSNRGTALRLLLRRLARRGVISWRGGKPKGSDHPIELTPGPPISSYIIEDRR